MFSIKSVELTNFRSFAGTHKWVLSEGAGLYFLTGRNDLNSRLGRNGVGKSSLLDAISWGLYGKTTRGLRASDVITWGEKSCSVLIDLVVGDETLEIRATQGPNSLTINGELVDRETLVKRLRLNYESFLYAVIIPQFGDAFFDLAPAAKLSLFSQIMELDTWLDKSNAALEASNAINKQLQSTELEIATLVGQRQSIEHSIKELEQKSAQWASDQADKVRKLEIAHRARTEAYNNLLSDSRKVDEPITIWAKEANELEQDIKELNLLLRKDHILMSAF